MRTKAFACPCIVALAVLVSACDSSSPGSSNTGPSQGLSQLNTTPPAKAELDHVTWGLPYGEPYSLDPILAFDFSSSQVAVNLCDALMEQAPSGKFVPNLASKVTRPDPLTWVYTIREGVRFWDGSPMTMSDVLFSLNRSTDPKYGSFYISPWGQAIKSIKQTGSTELTVTTSAPDATVNEMMAAGLGMVAKKSYILDKGKAFGTPKGGVMCTGPFKLVRWTAGSNVMIARNPDYWNKERIPKVKEIEFKFVTDPSTLTNALLAGSIDGTYEAPLAGMERLQSSTTGKLYQGRNLQSLWLWVAHPGSPLGDVKARQALSMMIDRKGIARGIFNGTAQPQFAILNTGMTAADPQAYTAANSQAKTTPNLSKAKALISEANLPETSGEIAVTQGDTASIGAATTIQAAAKQLGLTFRLRELTGTQFATLFFDPKARKQYAAIVGNGYIYTPLQYLVGGWLPGASQNWLNYDNPQTTELIQGAQRATDVAESSRLLADAEARAMDWTLSDAGTIVPVVEFAERLYMNNRITGAPACFCYLIYPWAADLGAP